MKQLTKAAMTTMAATAIALPGLGGADYGEPRGIQQTRADGTSAEALKAMLSEINTNFEEYKATLDQKVAEEVKNGVADVITTDKLDKIDAALNDNQDAINQAIEQIAALQLGQNGSEQDDGLSEAERKYSAAWDTYFRSGDGEQDVRAQQNDGIRTGNIRAAASVGVNEDGGFTAPIEWDRTITDQRVEVSPMRRYASVQNVTGQGFKRLYNIHGTTSGWVGETDARPQTNTSQLKEYAFKFGEIYAMPAATQIILEDSEIDMAGWLLGEVNIEFGKQEGSAFVSGDGVNKPKGILQYTAAIEGALPVAEQHPFGPITEVNSGDAATLTADGLISLIYDLPEDRSFGAAFYANRSTHSIIRKMKDGQGNYLWQPPFQAGEPALILGQPAREMSGLPNVAAAAIPVLYGNMAETYRIFDRVGMSVLRDPYTAKPYVLFYVRKRVGGGLWNPEFMRYHVVAI